MGSTAGVRAFVQEIIVKEHPQMNEDIIEDVFVLIEKTPEYRKKLDALQHQMEWWVVNNWIGRYVKAEMAAASDRQVRATRTSLITGYTKLR